MTSRLRLTLLSIVLAVGASGCVAVADQPDPNNPSQLQVVTGWTTGTERAALYDLIDVFHGAHPGISVFDESGVGPRDGIEQFLTDRIANDNAPDSFAVSVGSALWSRAEKGDIQDLTVALADMDLPTSYESELLGLVASDDRIYGIPIGIERVNVVWSNSALLSEVGLDPSQPADDLDTWLSDLETLRRSGVEYPLALGDATTQLQLFESVLIADLGGPQYKDLWLSIDTWQAPELATAIDHFDRLLEFTNPTTRTMSADRLVSQVISGDSAYAVLADSSLAVFAESGFPYREFYGGPVPGTGQVFDLSADAFVLPVGASHQESALAWLRVVGSAEGQEVFAARRGTVPARFGTAGAFNLPYQVDAKWALDHQLIVPSLAAGVAASPEWTDAIVDAATRFVKDRSGEALGNSLIDAAIVALAE